MAVNRRWKDKTGESKEEVCFITVVAWDKQAEVCNQYLRKGAPVFVEGRLQSRSWEDATGGKRSVVEVRAERVQFLSSSQGASGAREQSQPDADVISEVSPQQVDSDSLQEDNIS
ncbi:MAG: hypothetical protein A2216_00720, partial [Omnitrophica WOR_2 bacterium RIFOXYA2_FULL_45_12]